MPVFLPPLIPDAQPPAVRTAADVVSLMRREVRESETAPVRDALVDFVLGVLLEFQYRSDLAERDSDAVRAAAVHLRELGAERGFAQAIGEPLGDFRNRILSRLNVTTKDAIVAAVNALLLPYTTTECILLESSLDGWFLNDGTDGDSNPALWHSFLGRTPSYPDRLYEGDEEQNGGVTRPNSDPQYARVFDGTPRQFLLLVPDLTGFSDDAAWLWEAPGDHLTQIMAGVGWFIDDGTDPNIGSFLFRGALSETVLYETIVRTVGLLVGQSISWMMHATLEAA